MESKKMVLVALNAKYIHSNLGVHSIRAYCKKQGVQIEVAEYTINNQMDSILASIYEKTPDILGFSCYIWNICEMAELAAQLHKIMPEVPIWFGGPEVSYQVEEQMEKYPFITGIIMGEGEATVAKLKKAMDKGKDISEVSGIAYRDTDGMVHVNAKRAPLEMDDIPFAYEDLEEFENRILYYESSRGCPFSCSYCLSAAECGVRFRSMELVEKELQFFLDRKVPQVKFVDRTFNANPKHTMAIWKYIYEHDNGVTNFHFEISADLIREEEIEYIKKFRPGLVQFEIGVQSTNMDTIQAIDRKMDLERLKEVVKKVKDGKNVHQHLDLIAGLPYENLESFKKSFNDVYEMKPDQLQLGFLKVLSGSPLQKSQEKYGIEAKTVAPYEVLFTNWISYRDVLYLKGIEEMVEVYYNSGQFVATVAYLETKFESAFSLYESLAKFYKEKELHMVSHSRMKRYTILEEYAKSKEGRERGIDLQVLYAAMTFDLYARERLKSHPDFAGEALMVPRKLRKEAKKVLHYEKFSYDILALMETKEVMKKEQIYEFDYSKRDALTNQATVRVVPESIFEMEKEYDKETAGE